MLTRLIVDLYAWLVEISLWFLLLISGIAGYHFAVPILDAGGLIPATPIAWKMFGALVFASATFLVSAVLSGPFLVLVDIRKSVRALERQGGDDGNGIPSAGRRDLRDLRKPVL